jgi:hypothetical protein
MKILANAREEKTMLARSKFSINPWNPILLTFVLVLSQYGESRHSSAAGIDDVPETSSASSAYLSGRMIRLLDHIDGARVVESPVLDAPASREFEAQIDSWQPNPDCGFLVVESEKQCWESSVEFLIDEDAPYRILHPDRGNLQHKFLGDSTQESDSFWHLGDVATSAKIGIELSEPVSISRGIPYAGVLPSNLKGPQLMVLAVASLPNDSATLRVVNADGGIQVGITRKSPARQFLCYFLSAPRTGTPREFSIETDSEAEIEIEGIIIEPIFGQRVSPRRVCIHSNSDLEPDAHKLEFSISTTPEVKLPGTSWNRVITAKNFSGGTLVSFPVKDTVLK